MSIKKKSQNLLMENNLAEYVEALDLFQEYLTQQQNYYISLIARHFLTFNILELNASHYQQHLVVCQFVSILLCSAT